MPEPQYVALYPEAILFLARSGECDALSVLVALCAHADGFGGCDPGDERLGKRSGHRRDAVPALLERLQALDYIHIIETCVPYRQQPLRGFKINPLVIRLRSENQASAMADWKRFDPQTITRNEKQTTSITFPVNDQQPDQNQNQLKNQINNQLQKSAANQRKASRVAADQSQKPLESEGQPPEQDGEETHAGEDTRPETGRTASAGALAAPPPTEPRNLTRYKKPLADDVCEDVAMEMVSLAGDLSHENARMLVDTYGWERADRVVILFRQGRDIQQPARWMRAMMRKFGRETEKASWK